MFKFEVKCGVKNLYFFLIWAVPSLWEIFLCMSVAFLCHVGLHLSFFSAFYGLGEE